MDGATEEYFGGVVMVDGEWEDSICFFIDKVVNLVVPFPCVCIWEEMHGIDGKIGSFVVAR